MATLLEIVSFEPQVSGLTEDAYLIYNQAFSPKSPVDFIYEIYGTVGFAAQRLGQTVGIAFVELNSTSTGAADSGRLERLATREGVRKQGIGDALLGVVETYARQTGKTSIELLASGDDARAFYAKRDYRILPGDGYLMKKSIA